MTLSPSGTATHEINGDDHLRAVQRLQYLFGNARRWFQGNPRRTMFSRWSVPDGVRHEARRVIASPGRVLARAFVQDMLPASLRAREVAVLDVGCGSGGASRWLEAAGLRGIYLGIDADDRFDDSPGAALTREFYCTDAHAFAAGRDFDLIFSNSALEHIPDDAPLWPRLRGFLRDGGVQIHIVPSRAALLAYLWHGFRQYGPRDIFDRVDSRHTRVYRLGGPASLALHVGFITVPEVFLRFSLRRRLPRVYGRLLAGAFAADRWLPFGSLMYAVVETSSPPR